MFEADETQVQKRFPDVVKLQPKLLFRCFDCEKDYNSKNLPLLLSCGHTICSNCRERHFNKKFICSRCLIHIPDFKSSVINGSLLEQLTLVNKNEETLKFFVDRDNAIHGDPLIRAANIFERKAVHFEYLQKLFQDIVDSLKTEDELKEITNKYVDAIKDFNSYSQTHKLSTSLRKLASVIEPFEADLYAMSDKRAILKKARDVKNLFFYKFKFVHLDYDLTKTFDSLKRGFRVYLRLNLNDHHFYAQFVDNDAGVHLHSFRTGEPELGGFVFSISQFNQYHFHLSHIFFDLQVKMGAEYVQRRVYIRLSPGVNREWIISLVLGIYGTTYKGCHLHRRGRFLVSESGKPFTLAYKPMNYTDLLSKKEAWPCTDDSVGFVTAIESQGSVAFQICMRSEKDQKESRQYPYCIGMVESGMHFLSVVKKSAAVHNCGIVLSLTDDGSTTVSLSSLSDSHDAKSD